MVGLRVVGLDVVGCVREEKTTERKIYVREHLGN